MTLLALLATALLLAAAVYAQYRVAFHTAGPGRTLAARAVLALVGLAFGYVMSAYAQAPAAIVHFLKRARGAGKS